MGASAEMPYFIKPSIRLTSEEKEKAYELIISSLTELCKDEEDPIIIMSTINCLIKTHIPYAYWVGFYLMKDGILKVGPYQGTMGCLYIELGKGVCGKAAQRKETQVVADCHVLAEGSDHITCDPNSRSEIVVPVFDKDGKVKSVLDIDATLEGCFDMVDKEHLERLASKVYE